MGFSCSIFWRVVICICWLIGNGCYIASTVFVFEVGDCKEKATVLYFCNLAICVLYIIIAIGQVIVILGGFFKANC